MVATVLGNIFDIDYISICHFKVTPFKTVPHPGRPFTHIRLQFDENSQSFCLAIATTHIVDMLVS